MRGGPAHRMLGTFDCRRSNSKLSRYRQCTVRVTGLRSVLSPFWDRPQRVQQPPRTGLAIAMSCKQVGLPLPGEALSVVTGSRCLSRGVQPDRMRSCFAELRGSFVQTRSRLRLSCCGRIAIVPCAAIRCTVFPIRLRSALRSQEHLRLRCQGNALYFRAWCVPGAIAPLADSWCVGKST
jgi:hypothetical protein